MKIVVTNSHLPKMIMLDGQILGKESKEQARKKWSFSYYRITDVWSQMRIAPSLPKNPLKDLREIVC